jgi:hypothetical protein
VNAIKSVGFATAAVLFVTSMGSATAGATGAPAEKAPVAGAVTTAPDTARPASWRDGVVQAVAPAAAATVRAPQRPSRAAARAAIAARQAQFAAFTLRSKATRDMRGVEKSLYRGKYFNTTAEKRRLCIVERESEGHYDVVNPGGSYFGAYQVSRALARGATWMMLKEHKKLMGEKAAKQVLAKLRAKPMNTWPRYWQDAAFHTIINYNGTLSGAAHWAGGRWHC